MKISTKGRYGLRAFIDLACYGAEEPVSISSISARQEISERYLVSVGDVLRALEGDLEPATCAALHSEDSCEIQGSCITKYVWKKVNESMAQTVDSIMINTLVEMNKEIKKEGQKDE